MSNKWLVVIVAALVLLGIGYFAFTYKNGQNTTNQNVTPVSTNQVSIENFSFNPASVTVKAGDTVTWTNNDSVMHTVKSADGLFNSGDIQSGGKFQFTFPNVGTFNYSCAIHPSMQGKVTVE